MTAAHQTTRCPNCRTAYRVTQEQLEAADGMVRCGKCLTTFNGVDCLMAAPSAPAPVQPSPPPPAPPEPVSPAPESAPAVPAPSADGEAEAPAPLAISARRDDDDDFLIDDDFDVARLAAAEPAAAGEAAPAVKSDGDVEAAADVDGQVEPAGQASVASAAERAPLRDQPAVEASVAPVDVDEREPSFTLPIAGEAPREEPASAAVAPQPAPPPFVASHPDQDDVAPGPAGPVVPPPAPEPAPAATAPADDGPDTGRVWPTIGWSAGTRADKTEDDPILFTAGAPVSPLPEELDGLAVDRRTMSRWRPATHNIIPEAGLIGRQPRRQTVQTWLWFCGCLVAATTLTVQLVYFNSLLITKDSPFWPLAARICPVLDCPLPASVDMDKILSTDLIIRSHPYTQGALLVDAVIVNGADFDQPFPNLTLTFENLQGVVVARRTFDPAEYLMGELVGMTRMPSRQPVKLELEIVDPGKDAVSFRLFVAK